MCRVLLVLAALLLASAPAARSAGGNCTAEVSTDGSGAVRCIGGVPDRLNDGSDWEAALAPLAAAQDVSFSFEDVQFDDTSFNRMLQAVFAVMGNKTVAVTLDSCTMQGQQVDTAIVAKAAASSQLSLDLINTSFLDNQVNMTGALAAQTNLNINLRLTGSELKGNEVMLAGLAAVGGAGAVTITLAEQSNVEGNKLSLIGALAVGADGSLTAQLDSTKVVDNEVTGMALAGLGGNYSLALDGLNSSTVTLEGNSMNISGHVLTDSALVATVTDIIVGIGFGGDGFDLGTELGLLQGQLCSALDSLDLGSADLPDELHQLLVPLLDKVGGMLCQGADPNANVDLASLAPLLEGLLQNGGEGLAGMLQALLKPLLEANDYGSLEDLLAGIVNGTMDWQAALDDLLGGLLTSPAGDAAAGFFSDLLAQLGSWLDLGLGQLGGGGSGDNNGDFDITQGDSTADSSADSTEDDGSGSGDLALPDNIQTLIDEILGSLNGASNGLGDFISSAGDWLNNLLGGLLGGDSNGSGSGDDSSGKETDLGSLLNDLITALTGGAESPLAGQDLTGLLPVLRAVVKDPNSREQLPSLISLLVNGGQPDMAALSPVISAVLNDKEAAAQLPSLLSLLSQLGITLGGDNSFSS